MLYGRVANIENQSRTLILHSDMIFMCIININIYSKNHIYTTLYLSNDHKYKV